MKRTLQHAALAASLSVGLALIGACGSTPAEPTTLTYGLTLSPTGIDPHLNASAELGIPLSSVYDTLVVLDPDTGEFVPGLAERWEISPDGLTYTFHLRQDVRFHDGTDFDAEAVRVNLEYVVNPDHHSQKAASMLGPFERAEALDEFTVALHLAEPFAPLLDSLAQVYLGMASPAALAEFGPTDYQFHQVGTGPYRFVEYVPDDHLTLERNPDYRWSPAVHHPAGEPVDRIVFLFYTDPATRALALEAGEVDVIGEVPARDAARLAETGQFTVHPVAIPGQPLQYLLNTRLTPTDELAVRQALIQAVDRRSVVEIVFGQYSPVAGSTLSANVRGVSEVEAFPGYDPEQASGLLEIAGWVDEDGDGIRERSGQRLELNMVVPPWGSNPEVAQLIQEAWEAMGAEVTLELVTGFGPLKEAQAAGTYHAIGLNFFGTDPDLLRSFFASDGLYSWTGFADPALDALLEDASANSGDARARSDLYAQAVERIRAQALILPVRDYVNLVVSSSRVRGLRFSAQGWFPILIEAHLTE